MMTHPLYPKIRPLKLFEMLQSLDMRVSQSLDQQLVPREFLALLWGMKLDYVLSMARY